MKDYCDHELSATSLPTRPALSTMKSESSLSAEDSSENDELEEPMVHTVLTNSRCDLEEDFGAWLQFVSQCLQGHPNMTAARRKKEEIFAVAEEKEESEEERCLRVVRSVLDEETVLEMATDFLQMSRGAHVPDWASLSFKSCYFDREAGEFSQTRFIY